MSAALEVVTKFPVTVSALPPIANPPGPWKVTLPTVSPTRSFVLDVRDVPSKMRLFPDCGAPGGFQLPAVDQLESAPAPVHVLFGTCVSVTSFPSPPA